MIFLGKNYFIWYLYRMSIYVDGFDKTKLFNIITGTTTFRDIETQFLEIPEFKGKQIYGMYNTYPDHIDITRNKILRLGTPPQSLDGALRQSILILTNLNELTPDAVRSYNMYNDLGFEYAQRNSKTSVWSRKFPFRKYTYKYEKSPNIDEENYSSVTASSSSSASTYKDKYDDETGLLRPTAPPLSSLLKTPSASSSFYPDTEEVPLTFTEEDTELIKTATDNNFDQFQICLSSIVFDEENKNCLSENEALVQKLRNAILNTDIQEFIHENESIEGVIAKLNSLTTNKKGGRRKSHKKPRRKSFRKKKRRCTHHSKKNVSRR